jgi:hypothetical protein
VPANDDKSDNRSFCVDVDDKNDFGSECDHNKNADNDDDDDDDDDDDTDNDGDKIAMRNEYVRRQMPLSAAADVVADAVAALPLPTPTLLKSSALAKAATPPHKMLPNATAASLHSSPEKGRKE